MWIIVIIIEHVLQNLCQDFFNTMRPELLTKIKYVCHVGPLKQPKVIVWVIN